MGQKVHPGGLRVGVIHDWKSNWYVGTKEFPAYIIEDVNIRGHIYGKLGHAGLSDILIRKDKQRITIDIYTARPGIVIGKSGAEVDALRREIHGMTHKNVQININEIKRPELDAKLVAQSIAEQLENRVSFRRAMKRSLASAIRSGAKATGRPHRPGGGARIRPAPGGRRRTALPEGRRPRRRRLGGNAGRRHSPPHRSPPVRRKSSGHKRRSRCCSRRTPYRPRPRGRTRRGIASRERRHGAARPAPPPREDQSLQTSDRNEVPADSAGTPRNSATDCPISAKVVRLPSGAGRTRGPTTSNGTTSRE